MDHGTSRLHTMVSSAFWSAGVYKKNVQKQIARYIVCPAFALESNQLYSDECRVVE